VNGEWKSYKLGEREKANLAFSGKGLRYTIYEYKGGDR